MGSPSAAAADDRRRGVRGLPPVRRPWRAVAVGLAVLAGVAYATPLVPFVLDRGWCIALPCDPLGYSPLGVGLADDGRTVQVAWPRCPGDWAIRDVQVQRRPSGSPYWDHPVVLWHLVGDLDGNKPVVFDVGRDHPGMRTTTPLAQPLPTGLDLQAAVTTEFTKWGGGLLFHPMRVSTITHQAVFRAAGLRPGMVDDQTRAWFLRNGGRAAGACMDTPKPGPVDRVAWPAMRILPLLSVLLIPMALVEGRRYRRDHPPPPPADPGGWGPPRREPRQGRERPWGKPPPSA